MAELDFSAMFQSMGGAGTNNPIESLYGIIPTYDNVQMQIRAQAAYFIEKYDLEDAREMFRVIDKMMSSNKNLTFFGSKTLQNLLAAYTQTELVRGIKVQSVNNTSSSEGVE